MIQVFSKQKEELEARLSSQITSMGGGENASIETLGHGSGVRSAS